MKTTNCKAVIEAVQHYLLEWAENEKLDYELQEETNEQAFVHIIDKYINLCGVTGCGRNSRIDYSWNTPHGVLQHFVEGAMFYAYYSDVNKCLTSWGLNPELYSNDKNWETYKHLICRDGQRLYNKIKSTRV